MKSRYHQFKKQAITLRKTGKTYGEISRAVNTPIPKSTLSLWFKNIKLSEKQRKRIGDRVNDNILRGQAMAVIANKTKRKRYLKSVKNRIKHLRDISRNKDVAKIIAAMLYLGEGSKTKRGSLMIGNSDPEIINLFLCLLRRCFNIDEKKFRCTLQCRADQDTQKLEKFWSKITKVPLKQFYKSRIDPRTIGRSSKKLDYKGVCRVDYFSSDVDVELKKIAEIVYEGL